MRILTSAMLGAFPHGFTTRQGGVSLPPFDSLNLGGAVGDLPASVAENWERLAARTGLAFARVRQVHGSRVVRAGAAAAPCEEADAVVTSTPGIAACVSVADCVPILLAHPPSGAVAAVHAGWRGTLARVAAEAVRSLADRGAAGEVRAVIGPSIGPCCYEVSPDLAERFAAGIGAEVVVRGNGSPKLDLWRANAAVLAAAGVRADSLEVLGRCTSCERELFFSHRRDAGRTGRQAAYIAPALS